MRNSVGDTTCKCCVDMLCFHKRRLTCVKICDTFQISYHSWSDYDLQSGVSYVLQLQHQLISLTSSFWVYFMRNSVGLKCVVFINGDRCGYNNLRSYLTSSQPLSIYPFKLNLNVSQQWRKNSNFTHSYSFSSFQCRLSEYDSSWNPFKCV